MYVCSLCITLISHLALDKNKTSGPTISCLYKFKSSFIRIGPWKLLWTHLTKKSRGTNLRFIKKYNILYTHGARTHYVPACWSSAKKKKSASVHRESAANPALAGVRQTFGHNKLWTISQWASVLIVKRWNYSSGGQSERVKQFATIHRRFVSSFSEDAGQSSLFL